MAAERGPDDVRRILTRHGISIQELAEDTSTATSAAAALNTSVASIAKSLLFFAGPTPVLVVASGDTRVIREKLAGYVNAPTVRLAKPAEVLERTGYHVGGVPPVAHATLVRVLVDRRLMEYDVVYASAGSPLAIFSIAPERLVVLAEAEVVDVTERP